MRDKPRRLLQPPASRSGRVAGEVRNRGGEVDPTSEVKRVQNSAAACRASRTIDVSAPTSLSRLLPWPALGPPYLCN